MRGQEWLENVVNVREKVEMQQREVRVKLHELKEGPQGQSCDSRLEDDDGLNEEEAAEVPIHLDGELSEVVHHGIYKTS